MAVVDTADLISISEAARLGVSALVREAEEGHERVVLRNNKPVAAVVGMERLERLQQLEDDLLDISLAAARMMTSGPERVTLDEVLAHFGYTREQLAALPDE
jgi:prevent-host-death family protein